MPAELGPKKIQESKEPLIIRGHHSWNVRKFGMAGDSDPRGYSEYLASTYRKVAFIPGLPSLKVRDITGYTKKDLESYTSGSTKFFTEYNELSPNDPVVLVADGQKDGICASCVRGKHCDEDAQKIADAGWLTHVSQKAHELGFGDDISMVATEKGLPLTLVTTADTLSKVMEVTKMNLRNKFEIEDQHK